MVVYKTFSHVRGTLQECSPSIPRINRIVPIDLICGTKFHVSNELFIDGIETIQICSIEPSED